MAWPAVLPTFTGGMTAGVAAACQKLSDALATLAGARTAYTPTWAAATTNPTLGTGGTLEGRWRKVDREVKGSIQIIFGTGGTGGSGAMTLTLPTAALRTGLTFKGAIRDVSASKSYPMFAELTPTSNQILSLRLLNTTAGGEFIAVNGATGANPITFGVGDYITLDFEYETP